MYDYRVDLMLGGIPMIVNPWLFYAMNVCSAMKMFSLAMSIITGFIFIGVGCFFIVYMIDGEEVIKIVDTVAKWMLFLFVLFTLMYIFIPGKDTLLMMQAAKLTTTDNVNAVFESLKSAIDYAMSVLN